jgi:uncharacterized RDD family membrane protein YckC
MNRIKSAAWQSRFWAWLIDMLLMGIIWYLALAAQGLSALEPRSLGFYAGLLFLYWTALEGYRGQSMGKMVLEIVVVGPVGESIGFTDAAIESFGKAFLLPLDCLAGWIAWRGSGQRLFNRLSNTIVAYSEEVEDMCSVGP